VLGLRPVDVELFACQRRGQEWELSVSVVGELVQIVIGESPPSLTVSARAVERAERP
jgi:hypothetical protein